MQLTSRDANLCVFRPHKGTGDVAVNFCAHMNSTKVSVDVVGVVVDVFNSLKKKTTQGIANDWALLCIGKVIGDMQLVLASEGSTSSWEILPCILSLCITVKFNNIYLLVSISIIKMDIRKKLWLTACDYNTRWKPTFLVILNVPLCRPVMARYCTCNQNTDGMFLFLPLSDIMTFTYFRSVFTLFRGIHCC